MSETKEEIGQLQMMEQNLQQISMQRQQFSSQLIETDSALKELKDKKDCYKIIGNLMVLAKKEDVEKDLKTKKETLELRIKTVEKQESTIKEKAAALREKVLKKMDDQDAKSN